LILKFVKYEISHWYEKSTGVTVPEPFWNLSVQGGKCEFTSVNDHFFNAEMMNFRRGSERLPTGCWLRSNHQARKNK